ncbi:pro-opiomelanocortin precursor [Pelodiscus sinensis]|uniref:Proopiomelanocortin n=1 Tax=Pelodiscus sinensis TaxID=13735 RepID=Q7ZTV4_PELSI|nr:pro-opiomelanocortin precursor [Pelodiscus sinensis]AAM34798.1 proopiomelanocortin [Pelodiscus sinensis]|eukprot:NP_001273847.1 pro-opiomelanocortin precursor [Pelodiscus sinensis]
MLKPVRSGLLAILGVLLFHADGGVHSQCWDSSRCRELSTDAGLLECIKACKMDLSDESPMYPGNGHLQPLSENIRKYVMSHFRWNKFGRKNSSSSVAGHKREEIPSHLLLGLFPDVAPAQRGDDGEGGAALERQDSKRSYSMEHFRWGKPVGRKRRPIKVYPSEVEEESAESYPPEFRRDLSMELDYPEFESLEDPESEEALVSEEAEKKDGNSYKMHHFRWNAPPKDKRYGGFMTSESSQTPLMTLFKNAIIKNAYKKGQ